MNINSHLNIPSPLSKVETSWTKEYSIELWMKRDDLIHPLISGNKWRKLSGILSHYNGTGYKGIITYGGAFSNHLVATAVSCAIMGTPCTGVIRGDEPKELNSVLRMCTLYGMRLSFVSRQEYKETNRTQGVIENILYIPEGGACEQGTVGCQDILSEVDLENISKVFVACGTGTTITGMARHLEIKGNNTTQLSGIQVLKGEGYIAKDISDEYGVTSARIYDEFHAGGYAKTNKELMSFIKNFASETGILLDPIYTGKMMLAIKKLAKQDKIISGDKIIAIHTGGLTGWFGKHQEL